MNKKNYNTCESRYPLKFFLLIFLLIIFQTGLSANIKRIAIVDFTVDKKSVKVAEFVRNKIQTYLINKNKYNILEREKLKLILIEKKLSFENCRESSECKIRIGQLISADYLITGNINYLDNSINIRIIDVVLGKIISAESFFFKNENQISGIISHISTYIEKNIDKFNYHKSEINKKKFSFSLTGNYLIPFSDYKELVNNGYGATIGINIENLLIHGFFLGLKSSYFYYLGKNHIKYSYNIPVMLHTGYSINIYNDIYIIPFISFGPVYNFLKLSDRNESKFETILNPGISIQFRPKDTFGFKLTSEYYNIFERDSNMKFLSFGFGLDFYL